MSREDERREEQDSPERRRVAGRAIPLPGDDIDTDRIIPARYLKCVTFEDLGRHAFHDERFDEAGRPKEHPFNDPRFRGGSILLVGRNFGCGSSREHAPQSLLRSGIRALAGESFAEIFSGNCTALGIPAVRARGEDLRELMEEVRRDPGLRVEIDLEAKVIRAAGRSFPFDLPEADRRSLVSGSWDTTSELLRGREAIRRTASRLPYLNGFSSR